jgi:tRNA(Ile)-lysidine synthase
MARQPSVPERVREFLLAINPKPAGIIAAVSGGADSVALLRALVEVFGGRLIVAHFHHGLRGQESDDDAAFVADLAGRLRLPFRTQRSDLGLMAHGRNLEAAARHVRYEWLAGVARAEKIPFVATGHTADDQAETVLFHVLRGTGLVGLRGIARRRRLNDETELLRPLLDVSRARIERYLHSINQAWREDSTNVDRRFTRNRIRRDLLPLLARDYNPQVSESLARLGREAVAWRRAQMVGIARRLRAAELPKAGNAVVFDRTNVEALSRHTLRALWAAIWQREGWPLQQMGYRDFQRIAQWSRSGSAALELPGGVRLSRRERTIVAEIVAGETS